GQGGARCQERGHVRCQGCLQLCRRFGSDPAGGHQADISLDVQREGAGRHSGVLYERRRAEARQKRHLADSGTVGQAQEQHRSDRRAGRKASRG
ncbi:unnamed protein product, partial [Phaeothamnion confervicola]